MILILVSLIQMLHINVPLYLSYFFLKDLIQSFSSTISSSKYTSQISFVIGGWIPMLDFLNRKNHALTIWTLCCICQSPMKVESFCNYLPNIMFLSFVYASSIYVCFDVCGEYAYGSILIISRVDLLSSPLIKSQIPFRLILLIQLN